MCSPHLLAIELPTFFTFILERCPQLLQPTYEIELNNYLVVIGMYSGGHVVTSPRAEQIDVGIVLTIPNSLEIYRP